MGRSSAWALLRVCVLPLTTAGCTVPKGSLDDLIGACGDQTLEDLSTSNDVSDECKDAIDSLLPEPQENLTGNALAAGRQDGDAVQLYVLGTDADGTPLDLSGALTEVRADGEALPATSYSVVSAADLGALALSASSALDYSGSMSDIDIDDATLAFQAIYAIPLDLEARHTIFSATVQEQAAFTDDKEALAAALVRDDLFTRDSTALYDAMGAGISAVAARNGPVRLMIVATDGGENASTISTDEEALYDEARASGVHVVVMGALLADVDFMQRAASETEGLYFYAHSFDAVATQVDELAEALSEMGVVEIDDPTYTGAGTYEIDVAGATLSF